MEAGQISEIRGGIPCGCLGHMGDMCKHARARASTYRPATQSHVGEPIRPIGGRAAPSPPQWCIPRIAPNPRAHGGSSLPPAP